MTALLTTLLQNLRWRFQELMEASDTYQPGTHVALLRRWHQRVEAEERRSQPIPRFLLRWRRHGAD